MATRSTRKKPTRKKPTRQPAASRHRDIYYVADMLGVSYDFVWQRLRRGEFEGMRAGNRWRMSDEQIGRAVASMTTKPAA